MLPRVSATTYGLVLVVVCIARVSAQQPPAGGPPQGPPGGGGRGQGEQPLQNIKILKDIPRAQVQLAMQYMTASLGVGCDHCHVQGPGAGFDKDDKDAKLTARKMMQMVMDINSRDFEGRSQVSCMSCHNGKLRPERTPALAVEMTPEEAAAARARAGRGRGGFGGPGGAPQGAPGAGGPPQGAPPQGGAPGGPGRGAAPAGPPPPTETLDQVIDKYIQALGGRPALEKATTRVLTGTVMMRDLQTSPVTVQEKANGAYRLEIATQPNPTLRASDATTAWTTQGPQGNVRDLDGFQKQQALRLADFGLPLHIKERYTSLVVRRYGTIDGKETIVVTGRSYPDVTEQLNFDKETGLLVRRTIATATPLGPLPEQVDYSDYRDAGGVKTPYAVRYSTWNSLMVAKYTDVKINAPVADTLFAKPAAAVR